MYALDPDPAEFESPDENSYRDLSETYAPHILIFSSGDMTPFELHLLGTANDQQLILEANLLGDFKFADDADSPP